MKNLFILIVICICSGQFLAFQPLSAAPAQGIELPPEVRMESHRQEPSSIIPKFLKASKKEIIRAHREDKPFMERSIALSIFSMAVMGAGIVIGAILFSVSSNAAFGFFFTGACLAFLLGIFGLINGIKGIKAGRENPTRWKKSRVGTILASIVLTGITSLVFIALAGLP